MFDAERSESKRFWISLKIFSRVVTPVKFSKPESKIKITTNRDSEKAFLIVKDWGIGIPKEKLNRVFDKFYKTDDSKTQKYGGLGLGLSIAKKIIEENSGKIEIESEEGLGTTCRIILPLAKEE